LGQVPSHGGSDRVAVEKAARTLREIRIAEVEELDMQIENGKVTAYRAKIKISFKFVTIEERQFYKDPTSCFLRKNTQISMVKELCLY